MMFVNLFTMFFRIGLFGFGGGMAMLPLIFQSVQTLGIMSNEEFSNLVALSQVTPGPMAVNAATYVGYNFAGFAGAIVATLGVCLPSFVLMILIYKFFGKFNDNKIVQGVMSGIRPVTVALIGAAVIYVSENVLVKGPIIIDKLIELGLGYFEIIPVLIFVVSILLVSKFKMKPIRVMILMAILGAILCGQVA